MRDFCKISPAPQMWTDHRGRSWKVPQILGRLKPGKCAGHAALREFVIGRDGGKCKQCGNSDPVQLVADHILSRRNGGQHHPDNLQCLCTSCNARKSSLVDSRYGR